MSKPGISDEAVEAVAAELYNREGYAILFADARNSLRVRFRNAARLALEGAAPLAEAWGDGYLAGLADMQNGQERPNPYRS